MIYDCNEIGTLSSKSHRDKTIFLYITCYMNKKKSKLYIDYILQYNGVCLRTRNRKIYGGSIHVATHARMYIYIYV